MKNLSSIFIIIILLLSGCTSQKKLSYLSNLPETGGEETFTMEIPDYKIQSRDILYITIKSMTPDGKIIDFLSTSGNYMGGSQMQSDAGGFFSGYDVKSDGNILLPVIGLIKLEELTLDEARELVQSASNKVFNNATVECKLLSFKFTVIGEVRAPGAYINYNNYLTVLEAIGRAGGVGDFGNRDNVLVIRPVNKGTKTFRLNLQDKNILSSEAYFLLPNDIVIIEPLKQKIFNQNLPTISFVISSVTGVLSTTLLLINYFAK